MIDSILFVLRYIDIKRWLILGYIALFFESITPIIAIVLQRDLIDNVFIDQQYHMFPLLISLYALFFFSPKLFFSIRRVIFSHIAYGIQMNITEKFIRKIYNIPEKDMDYEHSGKLLNNIRNDISDATDVAINQLLSDAMKSSVTIVFLAMYLIYINVVLFFVVIVIAIIYYVLLHILGDKTKNYSRQVRTEKGRVSINIEENISGAKEVVAYNRHKLRIDNFETNFETYFKAVIAEGFYKAKTLAVSEPFLYGTKLVVIYIGGRNVISNTISLGEFVISFNLVDQLVTELGQIFQQALKGKRLAASVDCIRSVLDKPDKKVGTFEFNDKIESIKLEGVTFRYASDSEPTLNDITIEFPVGKKTAIVGESGSGKSTISKLLIKNYFPDRGSVLVNKNSTRDYNEEYTDKISIVFQEPYLMPTTIKENLTFGNSYSLNEIQNICKGMQCHNFIEDFPDKYETLVGERGAKLSGGQRQRIALSRAILKNTDVLILDEATSALDTETEYHVQKNIDKIRIGKTTIIIAHRISTILNADMIYVLSGGKVVAQGTHETLIKDSNVYQDLYRFQQRVDLID